MNRSSLNLIFKINFRTVLTIYKVSTFVKYLSFSSKNLRCAFLKAWKKRLPVKVLCMTWIMAGMGLSAQTQLNQYLTIAAEENPNIKAKYNQYLAALENVNQQGVLPDPTLSFGYFISPVETRVGAQQFRLSVSQMFPWLGTLKAREQAAANIAKARFEEFEEVKNTLFFNVKTKWLSLYEVQEEIRITTENLNILRSYEPITKTKYEANLVSLADLIRVQIIIEQSQTKLELLELNKSKLLGDFNTLLNRPLDTQVQTVAELTPANHPFASLDSAMSSQPRIKALKANLAAIDSEVALAQLKRKPNIGVGLDYVMVNERKDMNVPDNGKDVLMPMVTLSLPIFGKKNQSIIKEAELRKESVSAQFEGLQNEIKNSWNSIDYEVKMANAELQLNASEVLKTQSLLRVLTSEYTNDNRNFEDLLATQQTLLQLQLNKIRSTVKYQKALYNRDYLTGSTLNELR